MIGFANIWQYLLSWANSLATARILFRAVILSAFICGQVVTAAHSHADENNHAHEHHHEHEEQEHRSICQLCVLTTTDENIEGDFSSPEILDGPDFLNLSAVMSAYRDDAWKISANYQFASRLRFKSPIHLLDAARAPPLN